MHGLFLLIVFFSAHHSQDRPALPLRVIHKPGALAAGIETLLTVELVAESVGDFVGEVRVVV